MYDDILPRLGLLNAEQLAGARAAFLRESPSEGALVAALAGALPLAVDEEVIIIASGDGADEDAVAEAALFAGRAVAPPSVLYTARERRFGIRVHSEPGSTTSHGSTIDSPASPLASVNGETASGGH